MPPPRKKSLTHRAVVATFPPVRRLVAERDSLRRRLTLAQQRTRELTRETERLGVAVETADRLASGAPEDLGYLLIVTYGRSGSTLLQGVLNSIPGFLIRGENRAALHHLFLYEDTIVREKALQTRPKVLGPQKSWFGIDEYPEELAMASLRTLVLRGLLRPQPDTRVTGFKEIRWWQKDWEAYFEFLDTLFPGMRIVINTRNHEDVAKSKWWAQMDDPLGKLDDYEARLSAIAARFGDRAYRLHYDDWTADHDLLRGLYEWLGEPFDRETVDAVMAVRHSH